jgi:hypothetical protein
MRRRVRELVIGTALAALTSGCISQAYRPGALDAGRPQARDASLTGIDPDGASEDLFFRNLGVRGACVRGLVLARHGVRLPLAGADVDVRGTTPSGGHVLRTRTDHEGRFMTCFSRDLDRVTAADVHVQHAGFVPATRSISERNAATATELVILVERL